MITTLKHPNDSTGDQTATFPLATQCTRNVNYFIFEQLRLVDFYLDVVLNILPSSSTKRTIKNESQIPVHIKYVGTDSWSLNNIFFAYIAYVSFLHEFVEKINFPQGQTVTFVIVGSDVANCDSSVSDRWGTSNMFLKFPGLRRKCMFMNLQVLV